MKKVVVLLLITMLIISLSACKGQNDIDPSDEIGIRIQNDCDNVFGVHIEYYLADRAVGGLIVSRNPAMDIAIDKGEVLYPDIPQESFSETDNFSEFGMEAFVVLENGEEVRASDIIQWSAELGETYDFRLYENDNGEYVLEKSE